MTLDWNTRIDDAWSDDTLDDRERIALIDTIAADRPADDGRALFERAGARDSAGLEADAEGLYRQALEAGLDEDHRLQATIQLASTIRNLCRTDEALAMLQAEYDSATPGPMADAVAAFFALALASSGQAERAASVALQALAPHLPRYTRSVTGYARELVHGRA